MLTQRADTWRISKCITLINKIPYLWFLLCVTLFISHIKRDDKCLLSQVALMYETNDCGEKQPETTIPRYATDNTYTYTQPEKLRHRKRRIYIGINIGINISIEMAMVEWWWNENKKKRHRHFNKRDALCNEL